ncbi:hypothetical protein [Fibrella arboris]|uniref:hypothetical protein n=1 Tax=Fibrella arboris TaxID=3242486 RepID=UPI0035210657
MAVWLLVWGKNTIGDIQETAQFLTSQTIDIPLDLDFLSKINLINPQNEIVAIDTVYRKELWEVKIKKDVIQLSYDLPCSNGHHYTYPHWRFSVYFFKDIISFSGSYLHFSSWYEICLNENLKNGWLSVIRAIYRYLNTEKIIFFTEWGFGWEDAESFDELRDYVTQNPERVADNLSALENTEKLYFETLINTTNL